MSGEDVVQQKVRLAVAAAGVDLWRNNVGLALHTDQYGQTRAVRYGLLNDSEEINERFKSSDLIGIRPMLVTQEWVGQVVGVFSAIETKKTGLARSMPTVICFGPSKSAIPACKSSRLE